MDKDIIVIKIGTNSLLDANGQLDKILVDNLVEQINIIRQNCDKSVVLVSSGAVGLGKDTFKHSLRQSTDSKKQKQFYASIGQASLIQEYQKRFIKYDIVVAQILLTRQDFADRKTYIQMRDTLNLLIENGVLPIINENDVIARDDLYFSDNDELSAYVAGMLSAQKLLILSDVEGLYDKHPSMDGAKIIQLVDKIDESIIALADTKKSSGGRGGMLSKLNTARLMMSYGIDMVIAKAKLQNVAVDIVNGKSIGTLFKSKVGTDISGLRKWLNAGAHAKGKIIISNIIADLLSNKKRSSILASGLEGVEGKYEKGEVVGVFNESGKLLGHGVVKFSSDDMEKFLSKDKEEIKDLIIIHADYFMFVE